MFCMNSLKLDISLLLPYPIIFTIFVPHKRFFNIS